MYRFQNPTRAPMPRREFAVLILLAFLAIRVDAQAGESGGVFVGTESVRIEASVVNAHVPIDGRLVVRCEVNNVSDSTLLISDTEVAGGELAVVIRGEDGREISRDKVAIDTYPVPRPSHTEKMIYWLPLFSGRFVGKRIEVYPDLYSKLRPGHRYKISAQLVSTPDPETSQQDLKSIFPFKARILRGEVESSSVWVTVEPPRGKAPKK